MACKYYSNEQKQFLNVKLTKEVPVKSELIDFESEIIKFIDVDLGDSTIFFFLIINNNEYQETNSNVPNFNRLILNDFGIRQDPFELSFQVGDFSVFKISVRIMNKIYVKDPKKGSKPLISLNDMVNYTSEKTPEENDKNDKNEMNDKNDMNNIRSAKKSFTVIQKPVPTEPNENAKKEESNFLDMNFFKFWKKKSPNEEEQLEKQESQEEIESEIQVEEIYLKGTSYEQYLFKKKTEKKKEDDRETFCEGFFIASFPQKEGQVIENSQSFPADCGHKECSSLPAMMPEIIARYPLKDTKNLELNNLAATICFPTGIKVCYSEENPPSMINNYVTPITNQKGERYYMMTYHFYYKNMVEVYNKLYEMHPLKHHLMKFADSYLSMNDEEMNKNVMVAIQKKLAKAQELGFRDYVYVPYCICLISKYPYVNEMKKCLQSIYTLISKNIKDNSMDINNLIMYLINSVPVPERETRVKFYIPYFEKGIKLICPKMDDIGIMNTSICSLLKYFNIDNLVIIFRLMLFEKKILFIDNDYTRLSLVTDNFISLLYPFQWIHTYIPIMSDQMVKYLETFLPFINGINTSLMNLVTEVFEENEAESSEEVFLVYISENKFRIGNYLTKNNKKKYKYLQDNIPALPVQLEKELKSKLKKLKEDVEVYLKNSQKHKKFELSDYDFRLKNIFIEMFVQMFHDYYKYMTFLDDDVVFNKALFLEKITNSSDKRFYDEFIDTQLFQMFCQKMVKDELKYFSSMVMKYDPTKKEIDPSVLRRNLANKFKQYKIYVAKPNYLKISDEKAEIIEKKIEEMYKLEEPVDEEGMLVSKERILTEISKIKDENYKNKNCLIYSLPEKETEQKDDLIDKFKANDLSNDSIIFRAFQSLKLKTNLKFNKRDKCDDISDKEKDNIKETIKDFTMKIFKSEIIEEDQNKKKELQNAINQPFGREFFVSILSKNATNIILLKEKSFNLLYALIYNSLLFILNIKETNQILDQVVILIKSLKYFGQEIKGKTTTIWDTYSSKIEGYSKLKQSNFWFRWYNIDMKKNENKDKVILNICDFMIELKLDKSFIKNTLQALGEKEFGKESKEFQSIFEDIVEKIKQAKYTDKDLETIK